MKKNAPKDDQCEKKSISDNLFDSKFEDIYNRLHKKVKQNNVFENAFKELQIQLNQREDSKELFGDVEKFQPVQKNNYFNQSSNPASTNIQELHFHGIQHKSVINSLSYCDISCRLVSGDSQGIIKLWDINTLSCIKTFADIHFDDDGKIQGNSITSIKFQNKGKTIAYINIQGQLRILDSNSLQFIVKIQMNLIFSQLGFLPNQKIILVQNESKLILFNSSSFKQIKQINFYCQITSMAFAHNKKFLALGSSKSDLVIYKLNTFKIYTCSKVFQNGDVSALSFNKTDDLIICGKNSIKNNLSIWTLNEKGLQLYQNINTSFEFINQISFSDDGEIFFIFDENSMSSINLNTLQQIFTLQYAKSKCYNIIQYKNQIQLITGFYQKPYLNLLKFKLN